MTPTFFLVRGYTNYFIGGHRRFLPFSGKSEKKKFGVIGKHFSSSHFEQNLSK